MHLRSTFSALDAYNDLLQFILDNRDDDILTFLDCWMHSRFDECRKGWPNAPKSIYIGADAALEESKLNQKLDMDTVKMYTSLGKLLPDVIKRYSKNDPKRRQLERINNHLFQK